MAGKGRQQADEALALALACGATVEGAARKAGVGERTVYRRLADPQFQQRLRALRGDMVRRAADLLTAASAEAVRTLLALQEPATPAQVRLSAAKAILELGLQLRETGELTERITALEEALTVEAG